MSDQHKLPTGEIIEKLRQASFGQGLEMSLLTKIAAELSVQTSLLVTLTATATGRPENEIMSECARKHPIAYDEVRNWTIRRANEMADQMEGQKPGPSVEPGVN